MAITESLIELFSRGGPVMFVIAGVSLAAWFLSLRTWLLAGSLLRRLEKMSDAGLGPAGHDPFALVGYGLSSSAIKARTARLGGVLRLVARQQDPQVDQKQD